MIKISFETEIIHRKQQHNMISIDKSKSQKLIKSSFLAFLINIIIF